MAYFRLCMSLLVAAGTAVGLLGVALEMIRARGTYQAPLGTGHSSILFVVTNPYIEISRPRFLSSYYKSQI